MYFYYIVAAMGPKYQKYLWWKKYLTTLQMIQFVGIMTHTFQLLFIECDYPIGFVYWIGGHALMFLVLFSNFYRNAYSTRKRKAIANGKAAHANGVLTNGKAKTNGVNHILKTNGYTNGHVVHQTNGSKTNGKTKLQNGNSNHHKESNGHATTNGDILKID